MNKYKELNSNKILSDLDKEILNVIELFCKKQDLYFDYAINDDLTGVICFSNEYFLNFSDIVKDLKKDVPKGFILQWEEDTIVFNLFKDEDKQKFINYNSYLMGLRYDN